MTQHEFETRAGIKVSAQEYESIEADMDVVGLFLKAIIKKGHYETYPMDGICHRLTTEGEFVSCGIFSSESKKYEFVRVMPCDMEYAWKVLKEKGYHLRKDGSMYCVDKVKWAMAEHGAGYYMF